MSESDPPTPPNSKDLDRENRRLREALDQGARLRRLWQEALEELRRTKGELEEAYAELEAMYKVASAVNRAMDLEGASEEILDAMGEILGVSQDTPRGIFLAEDDGSMRLVASRGSSQAFLEAHEGMRVGDCLCGRVVQDGETLVIPQCGNDPRHTITYPDYRDHSHIILPLRAAGSVIGSFYYYLDPDHNVTHRHVRALEAVADQLGLAIQHARLFEEARTLSFHDPLTGLANRRLLDYVLRRELAAAQRAGDRVGLIMLDLDNFKAFNDAHGHPAGDRLLTRIGEILKEQTRDEDLAVRYGGEEFLLVIRRAPAEGLRKLAERVRETVEEQTPLTTSLGVTHQGPDEQDPDALVARADSALYRAKEAGRNRVITDPQVG